MQDEIPILIHAPNSPEGIDRHPPAPAYARNSESRALDFENVMRSHISVPTPPPSAMPMATLEKPPQKMPRRIAPWVILVCIVALVILGAGATFAAYRMGYIQLPFLDPLFTPKDVLTHWSDDLTGMASGQTSLSFVLANEDATASAVTVGSVSDLPTDLLSSLPASVSLTGTLSSFIAKQPSGGTLPDSSTTFTGTYKANGMQFDVDADQRVASGSQYIFLRTIPYMGEGVNLDAIKNQWLTMPKSNETVSTSTSALSIAQFPNGLLEGDVARWSRSFFSVAVKEGYITLTKKEKSQERENATYDAYSLSYHPAQLDATVEKFLTDEATFCDTHSSCLLYDFGENKSTIRTELFNQFKQQTAVKAFFAEATSATHATLLVKRGGAGYKLEQEIFIAYPASIAKLASKQAHVKLTLSWDNLNAEPTVEVPSNALAFDDVDRLLEGYAADEWQFKKQADNISSIQSRLTVYAASHNGVYPAALSDLATTTIQEDNRNASATRSVQMAAVTIESLPQPTNGLHIAPTTEIPNDAYTSKAFSYTTSGTDYTISYTMQFPKQRDNGKISSLQLAQYVDGTNTADKYVVSREVQAKVDTDNDGLTGAQELEHHTNPLAADTDQDNFSDFEELQKGSDPLDSDSIPTVNAGDVSIDLTTGSANGGDLMNIAFPNPSSTVIVYVGERRAFIKTISSRSISIVVPGTKAELKPPTKKLVTVRVVDSGKTIVAGEYTFTGETRKDSDNDKLPDKEEIAIGTNPQSADSDGDSFDDYLEIESGHNPLVGNATDLPEENSSL